MWSSQHNGKFSFVRTFRDLYIEGGLEGLKSADFAYLQGLTFTIPCVVYFFPLLVDFFGASPLYECFLLLPSFHSQKVTFVVVIFHTDYHRKRIRYARLEFENHS